VSTPAPDLEAIRGLRDIGAGRTLVILATGPSVNEVADLDRLRDHPRIDTLAVNRALPDLDPTFLIFQDAEARMRLKDYLPSYGGIVLSALRASPPDQLNTVRFEARAGTGFSRELTQGVYCGKSTTYAAVQWALWMGQGRCAGHSDHSGSRR
jgi:hypothetical protein